MLRLHPLLALALPALASGQDATFFEDQSAAYGIAYQDYGGVFAFQMGVGAAWFDYDADGDEDLLLLNSGGDNRMLRRDGAIFTDASGAAQIPDPPDRDPMGAIAADFDQDGITDVYVTMTLQNMLLRSVGDGSFEDVAQAWGVDGGAAWSSSASVADFDRDGDLDLYVGNYLRQLSFPYHFGEPNQLFVNLGAPGPGSFVEMAAALGVDNVGHFKPPLPDLPFTPLGGLTAGCTLSTATVDYDDDGYADIQVGNDFGMFVIENKLYRNTTAAGVLAFRDVSHATGFDTRPHYDMGISPADFDRDGDWDFYMSNLGDNVLLRSEGGVFTDAVFALGPVEGVHPDQHGLAADGELLLSSWGNAFEDFDGDGWQDLYVGNGHIPSASFIDNARRAPNGLWINEQGASFRRVPDARSGAADTGVTRVVTTTDVNGDGHLDLLICTNRDTPATLGDDATRLFVNRGCDGNDGLILRFSGRFSNLEGIGVAADARVNGALLKRQLRADPCYLGSSSRLLHYGLGQAGRADRIDVRWPSGIEQTLLRVAASPDVRVVEPAVTLDSVDAPTYAGQALHLRARVENLTGAPVTVSVRCRFELAGGEVTITSASERQAVAPGLGEVALGVPLPAALAAHLAGRTLNMLVWVEALGASDAEIVQFHL